MARDDVAAPTEAAAAAVGSDALPAGLDLGAIMRQVHFAYRAEGDAFTGGHASYGVRVGPQGRVEVTPTRGAGERGAPLTLETVAVERGGAPLLEAPRAGVESDGSLAIARGAVVERLRNGEDGVEQSWAFAAPPAGEGDLVVRVRPSGQAYVGRTEQGHHFADAATGFGVRYGLATWVDAAGARTPVDVQLAAGDLVLTVPEAVLASSSFPAVLDPTVGPEAGVDVPLFLGAPLGQGTPAVAFDGSNFLVVWIDDRSGRQIVAARVSRTGSLLDPAGIVVTPEDRRVSDSLDLAFDGTNFLVVYNTLDGFTSNIQGVRVSTSGAVLDVPSFEIIPGGDDVSVAFGGQHHLVVCRKDGITAARVTKGGEVAGDLIQVTETGDKSDVAFDGTNFLVVWSVFRSGSWDLLGARVAPSGDVVDFDGLEIEDSVTTDSLYPAVAFDGAKCLVVYEEHVPGVDSDIRGRFVEPDGTVFPQTLGGIPVSADPDIDVVEPDLAFDGTNYLVAWVDRRDGNDGDIFGARVTPAGTVVDPAGVGFSAHSDVQGQVAVAFGGASFFLVWADERSAISQSDVWGARVSTSAVGLGVEQLVSTQVPNVETEPAASFDGTNYLVVWTDTTETTTFIRGARVTPAGVVLDPAGFNVSNGTLVGSSHPSVAWNGTYHLVAWQGQVAATHDSDIEAVRVTKAGVVVDLTDPIAVAIGSGHALAPEVAAGGGTFLVVWQRVTSFGFDVYGGRVSSAGVPLDGDGFAIAARPGDQHEASVAYGSKDFLVAWSDAPIGGPSDIRAARVTKTGTLLDGPASDGGLLVSGAALDQTRPAVAYGGSTWFVLWEDRRTGEADIYGTPVSATGAVASPAGRLISGAADDQTAPAIASHGKGYIAVWEDRRNGGAVELFGAGITKAGALLDATGFLVASGSTDHLAPALAARSGQVLCADQRFVPAFGELRILTRFIRP